MERKGFDPIKMQMDPDFCRWAWGVEINDRVFHDAMQLMHLWNERHGDLLTLKPTGTIHEDVCRMGGFWAMEGYPDGRVPI